MKKHYSHSTTCWNHAVMHGKVWESLSWTTERTGWRCWRHGGDAINNQTK